MYIRVGILVAIGFSFSDYNLCFDFVFSPGALDCGVASRMDLSAFAVLFRDSPKGCPFGLSSCFRKALFSAGMNVACHGRYSLICDASALLLFLDGVANCLATLSSTDWPFGVTILPL